MKSSWTERLLASLNTFSWPSTQLVVIKLSEVDHDPQYV